jgi:hypothetical protein
VQLRIGPVPGNQNDHVDGPDDDCGTINNTVTVSATDDVAPVGNNTDNGDITVSCGALQITKTAKHADSDPETGSSPNLVATFSIVDAGGNSHSITTDATGVGCVGGVTIGLTQSITETGVPTGYSAPTIANVNVVSGTCTSGVMTGGPNVPVVNTPLTTIGWSVDSLHDGGTSTVVTCRNSAGENHRRLPDHHRRRRRRYGQLAQSATDSPRHHRDLRLRGRSVGFVRPQ